MVTVIVTALSAILVFVLTQSFLKLVLEPIQEQRKLIGQIAHALLFYANVYEVRMLPPKDEGLEEDIDEARKALRDLAGQLRASLWTIPFYDALAFLGRVPKQQDVLAASDQLVGWSNSLRGSRGEERNKPRRIIAEKLGIDQKVGIV